VKVIIAGPRHRIVSNETIQKAVDDSGLTISELVCGMAPGVDSCAYMWAESNHINRKKCYAKWDDLTHPDALIKSHGNGKKYDARAGIRRNLEMAQYADALIAIWDKKSKGTKNMIEAARKEGITVFVSYI